MAETYTSNLELVKPDYDSPADIFVINSNMDKIDNAVANAGKVQSVNGQTGAVNLSASDVGALPLNGTAADSVKLGGVAASDYALKTDTAPDSSKLGGKAPEYYLQPRNLLDNSDFRNPVNQRGIYSAVIGSYIIDRWNFYNSNFTGNVTITQSANGITITNDAGADTVAIVQRFIDKNYYDGKYTAVVKTTDRLVFGYAEVVDSENSIYQVPVWIPTGTTVVWAALYEGSYTAETLPPYVPKAYVQELAECQRYYWKTDMIFRSSSNVSVEAINIQFPIRMRVVPTVKYSLVEGSEPSGFNASVDGVSYYSSVNFTFNMYEAIADL